MQFQTGNISSKNITSFAFLSKQEKVGKETSFSNSLHVKLFGVDNEQYKFTTHLEADVIKQLFFFLLTVAKFTRFFFAEN